MTSALAIVSDTIVCLGDKGDGAGVGRVSVLHLLTCMCMFVCMYVCTVRICVCMRVIMGVTANVVLRGRPCRVLSAATSLTTLHLQYTWELRYVFFLHSLSMSYSKSFAFPFHISPLPPLFFHWQHTCPEKKSTQEPSESVPFTHCSFQHHASIFQLFPLSLWGLEYSCNTSLTSHLLYFFPRMILNFVKHFSTEVIIPILSAHSPLWFLLSDFLYQNVTKFV